MLQSLLNSNTAETHLRAGVMNQYVTALQTLLHELGMDNELQWSTYGADGYYGQTTVNAVGAYGYKNNVPTNGMSVSTQLLNHMLAKSAANQPAPPPQPNRPVPPPPPPPPTSSGSSSSAAKLNVKNQGDRVVVSDGSHECSFIKRDAGLAYYGSITISQAIKANSSLMTQLGITRSALNVMESVSENEGKLDAINSYDKAFFSYGVFQWTIGTGDGTGELPALLKKFKRSFSSQFQQYFGAYGIDVSSDTTDTYGYLVLNGNKIDRASEKEQFRSPEWAFRFWLAGQSGQMQAIMIEHALGRLRSFYWTPKEAINGFTLSEIITSEYGVALLLDNHVNRPSWVGDCVEQAMNNTGLTNPTFWGTAEEKKVIDEYLRVRTSYTTGSAKPMTKANERAAVTQKYLNSGVISAERNSFQYSQQMVG